MVYTALTVLVYGARPLRSALEVLQRREQVAQFGAGGGAGLQQMSQVCVPLFDALAGLVWMACGLGGEEPAPRGIQIGDRGGP